MIAQRKIPLRLHLLLISVIAYFPPLLWSVIERGMLTRAFEALHYANPSFVGENMLAMGHVATATWLLVGGIIGSLLFALPARIRNVCIKYELWFILVVVACITIGAAIVTETEVSFNVLCVIPLMIPAAALFLDPRFPWD